MQNSENNFVEICIVGDDVVIKHDQLNGFHRITVETKHGICVQSNHEIEVDGNIINIEDAKSV